MASSSSTTSTLPVISSLASIETRLDGRRQGPGKL
jgi:hypothetical protein